MTGKSVVRPPLLPKTFGEAPTTLADEGEWDQVQAWGIEASGQLRDVVVRRSRLIEANLSGVLIDRFRCENTEFVRCDLSGAVWDQASLERVMFSDCRMTGLTLSGSVLRDICLQGCAAELANFRMAKAQRFAVESSRLRAADFYEAALVSCRLEDSDLRGASFQQAHLREVSLRGSELDDITGAGSLRGARVTPVQALVLGGILLAETGIEVEEEHGVPEFRGDGA